MSLRYEMMRILPAAPDPGEGEEQEEGDPDADAAWKQALQNAYVQDLWMVPEFRHYCRPFAADKDASGAHVPQPGLVIRFPSQIVAGKNFFGHPLGGGDHAYDPSNYATKIFGAGIWFSNYDSGDITNGLAVAPRVYLFPTGTDIMTIPTSGDSLLQRMWKVTDASIPVPLRATQAKLDSGAWLPAIDGLNGGMGVARKFTALRAYHNGSEAVSDDELIVDSRLVGRSVWNTDWVLIIPGLTLNGDAAEGLRRFIEQVGDIKLVFQTYGYRGS